MARTTWLLRRVETEAGPRAIAHGSCPLPGETIRVQEVTDAGKDERLLTLAGVVLGRPDSYHRGPEGQECRCEKCSVTRRLYREIHAHLYPESTRLSHQEAADA